MKHSSFHSLTSPPPIALKLLALCYSFISQMHVNVVLLLRWWLVGGAGGGVACPIKCAEDKLCVFSLLSLSLFICIKYFPSKVSERIVGELKRKLMMANISLSLFLLLLSFSFSPSLLPQILGNCRKLFCPRTRDH